MPSQLTISNLISGVPPYTFYVCDENGNNCSVIGSTVGTYPLTGLYATANQLLIKVVDSNLCEYFTVVPCETYIILTEDGFNITAENGDILVFFDY